MEEHSAGHHHDSLNGALSHTILMMGTNLSMTFMLAVSQEVSSVGSRGKGTIVALVALNADSHVKKEAFKSVFGPQGFGAIQGDLMLNVNE